MPYQASQRPFGVEIEFKPYRMPIQMRGSDLGRGWRIHDEHCGREAVSPILVGGKGHNNLARACDRLGSNGAVTDRHCGLHVHHDVSDLSKDQIIKLAEAWMQNESTIGQMVDPWRMECGWCNSLTARDIDYMKAGWYEVDRYKSLNVQAVAEHGTVEIRFLEGTLDYETIRAWIRFGQAFIHASKKRKRKLRKAPSTEILLDRVKVTPPEKVTLYKKMGLLPKYVDTKQGLEIMKRKKAV